jgi:hypothetical protein
MGPTTSFSASNRYRTASDSSIALNVLKTDDGWRVEAHFPKKLSGEDRLKLIDWFAAYRTQVRQMHPLWATRFSSGEQWYVLDIKAISNQRGLAEKGDREFKPIWTEGVANRA